MDGHVRYCNVPACVPGSGGHRELQLFHLYHMPAVGEEQLPKKWGELFLDEVKDPRQIKSIDMHCGLLVSKVGVVILISRSLVRISDILKTTKSVSSVLTPH